MAEKPERKPDDPEQSQRFVETANELEADESGERFREVMERIADKKESPKED